MLAVCSFAAFFACRKPVPAPEVTLYQVEDLLAGMEMAATNDPHARSCMECHPEIFEKWASSQHAGAMRAVHDDLDLAAFSPERMVAHGSYTTRVWKTDSVYRFTTWGPDVDEEQYKAAVVLAITPLRQYMVPFPGGRLQAFELGFDPRSNDWFNVFGEEDRRPHEWGHWANRGMNWNTQCAYCHTTRLEKNYDIATDSFATTWHALGTTCIQCHGPMNGHAEAFREEPYPETPEPDASVAMELCASCHTRREEITGAMYPGDRFFDHYRPTLVNTPRIYWADGQIRDEDFEYGSFLMSRKHHKGITCLDCHDPHSGKLLLPVENDALCVSCHAPPGRNGATPINLLEHSFHPYDSSGSRCVECHMAHTHYMVRDPRRDHGFVVPDPVLTKELGIPNSCNRCHDDQTVDWAVEWSEKWYGEKLAARPTRERARVIARAHEGREDVSADLVRLARAEEIPAWKYSLLMLLQPWANRPEVRALGEEAIADEHPLVRSAGIQLIAGAPGAESLLWPKLEDPVRLVRIDAAWALRGRIDTNSAAYAELRAQTDWISDQPGGAMRQAELALHENRIDDAVRWARKAADWEETSGYAQHVLGRILNMAGRNEEAIEAFTLAGELEPEAADHPYALALLYAEMKRTDKSREWLTEAVQRDPAFTRAWYNLGLAHAQLEELDQAVEALRKAEELDASSPDFPFARATVHLRKGENAQALAAARKALSLAPRHQPARNLIRHIEQQPASPSR